jgi:nucleoside-diphosphate-sugar epimerase
MNETRPITNQKPTALITGATGFVGSHLAKRLVQEGWRVHIVSRADSRLPEAEEFAHVTNHIYDGSTESMVNCVVQAKPDVVIHLASLFLSQHAIKDVNELIQSNVLLGSQLLEAMKVNQVTYLVNTGTSWQHYNNEDYNPVCLYAATKQAFEAIMEFYVQACGIKAITLNLFDTYGPADPRPKLFHLLEKAAKSGELLNMSAGEQLIDLVHIDDVVDAYLIAVQRLLEGKVSVHESYAVSSGYPMPLRKLVETYSNATGRSVNVNWGARSYRFREVMTTWCNGKSIENWKPKIDLLEGLKKVAKENGRELTS